MKYLQQTKDTNTAPLTENAKAGEQVQDPSVPMQSPSAASTPQHVKARLLEAGLVYHQRDGKHWVIKRGLEVRYQSRQRDAVLVEYALSVAELRKMGDEPVVAEIKETLSRAKEILEQAGLHAAFLGNTGMTLVVALMPAREEEKGNAASHASPTRRQS
jgi:hypothetical protein